MTSSARLRIVGAPRFATVIDAGGLGDRVLSVARKAKVTLSQLEITGGRPPDGAPGTTGSGGAPCRTGGAGGDGADGGVAGSGGAIYNRGKLTLKKVLVMGNSAGAGGPGGPGGPGVATAGCAGGNGGSGANGGGIYNDGSLVLTGDTIRANRAGAGGAAGAGGGASGSGGSGGAGGSGGSGGTGGGVYNAGTLSVTSSTIRDNNAGTGGSGGPGGSGVGPAGADGEGGAGGSGGGILGTDGKLAVTNSTFSANVAGAGGAGGGLAGNGGGGGSGGAIQATAEVSALRDATVADNSVGAGGASGSSGGSEGATGAGGGLSVQSSKNEDDLMLQNTIVASSVGGGCAGPVAGGGHNLSYGDTSCPGGNGNPELGALGNYGGPTATFALGSGSAAIDKVLARNCPATDQRGVRRPPGRGCDIGAFEFARPKIKIVSPQSGGYYGLHERTRALFHCTEGGIVSPIATCDGTVAHGGRISTRSAGAKTFSVTASDKSGTQTTTTVAYTVLPYTNPFKAVRGLVPGRIDMGVDYGGKGKILALGDGVVKLARDHDPGWPAGGWLMYRLSDGPFAGKYVYVAENITVIVRAGQRVKVGEPIAILHPAFPHLETGWAAGRGDKTLADVDDNFCPCGDPGGWSSIDGRNFDRLLEAVGAPSGYLQPNPPKQRMPPGWPRLPLPPPGTAIPQSSTPLRDGWIAPLFRRTP